MAAVAAVTAVTSAVISAVGAIKQGQAAQSAATFNSTVASQNAQTAAQQGLAAEGLADRKSQSQLGTMQASLGASGLESDTGSAVDVLASSAANAKYNSLSVDYNYQLKSLGYSTTATLDNFEGGQAAQNSELSAAGSLLGGAASAYGIYNKVRASGAAARVSGLVGDDDSYQNALGTYKY